MANPQKRKTRSGITRFITAWLAKEQNKGGSIQSKKFIIDHMETFRRLVCSSGGRPKNEAERLAQIQAGKANLGRANEFQAQQAWRSYINEAYAKVGGQPLST